MCGIAGIVGIADVRSAKESVQKMITALLRRGPDDDGLETWSNAVLGHRRLAIFDLTEAGHQPMLSPERSIGVVFNGAIYNYRELRQELMSHGYEFRSRTDTEVLIHGYKEWGVDDLVLKLRGMFAFGLWDDKLRKLYLVRDRLGVKPLVFTVRGGAIAFASTVRALRCAGYGDELNEAAVAEFLKFGFVPDDLCIYRGTAKLAAGTLLEWSNGVFTTRQYWRPPTCNKPGMISFEKAIEETERLFLQAVEIRLHADVPVAALLSGGIDSSLVCWAIKKLGGDLTAYTVGVPNDPWDETEAARITAAKIGIKHCVLEMSDWNSFNLDELVASYAEPFACASALGMLKVSRAVASSSAKVLLTGDGGDDVFLGYPRHRHLWLAGKLADSLPSGSKNVWQFIRPGFPCVGPLRRAVSLIDYATGGFGAFVGKANQSRLDELHALLGERLVSGPLRCSSPSDPIERPRAMLPQLLEHERKTSFVGEYLTKIDGATMYYGLESRSPFLDQCLWDFASLLPANLRLYHGRLKAVLREMASRRIGNEIARRRKRGFGVPVQRWIGGQWYPRIEDLLHDSLLARDGWICKDSVLQELKTAKQKGCATQPLWHIAVLESWFRVERAGNRMCLQSVGR